jgi:hypothetical protein
MTNEKFQITNDKWRPEVNSKSVDECPWKDVPDLCWCLGDEHANARHCLRKASRLTRRDHPLSLNFRAELAL